MVEDEHAFPRQRGTLRRRYRTFDAAAFRAHLHTRRRCCPTATCTQASRLPNATARHGNWIVTGSIDGERLRNGQIALRWRVLVAGGVNDGGDTLASAELYDSATRTGPSPAASTPPARNTRRHCRRQYAVFLQGGRDPRQPSRKRGSCTTRPPELGPSPAASILLGMITPRRCCRTVRRSSQAVSGQPGILASAELHRSGMRCQQGQWRRHRRQPRESGQLQVLRATQSDVRRAGDFSFADPAAGVCATKPGNSESLHRCQWRSLNGQARWRSGPRSRVSA